MTLASNLRNYPRICIAKFNLAVLMIVLLDFSGASFEGCVSNSYICLLMRSIKLLLAMVESNIKH